ncbi:MAG: YtxH domain-containing protein [Ignavibacteria bacterium]|nr:YtxH domain-containing protein [Ignavibacteria bacterium]
MDEKEQVNGSYTKGFLVGAVVGGAVGAVLALLFAPKAGRELRRDIADRTGDLYDKASEFMNEDSGTPDEMHAGFVNEGRIRAERIVSSAKHQADNILSNAEKVLRDAKNRSAQLHAGASESHGTEI